MGHYYYRINDGIRIFTQFFVNCFVGAKEILPIWRTESEILSTIISSFKSYRQYDVDYLRAPHSVQLFSDLILTVLYLSYFFSINNLVCVYCSVYS